LRSNGEIHFAAANAKYAHAEAGDTRIIQPYYRTVATTAGAWITVNIGMPRTWAWRVRRASGPRPQSRSPSAPGHSGEWQGVVNMKMYFIVFKLKATNDAFFQPRSSIPISQAGF